MRSALQLTLFLALIAGLRLANYPEVAVGGRVYFADGDCYARMTRVREVLTHGGVVRHHDFENHPQGTDPHTTAPLDYLIAGLALILRPLTDQAVDVAGALVSPLLGVATGGFLWFWFGHCTSWRGTSRGAGGRDAHRSSRDGCATLSPSAPSPGGAATSYRPVRYRGLGMLLYAVSPILVHGTALGRPDHQSLLIALLAGALGAEWKLGQMWSRGWSITAGAAWGLALWVSLYEPLVLLGLVGVVKVCAWGISGRWKWRWEGVAVMGGVLLLALAIEGWRFEVPGAAERELFGRWKATIGELASPGLFSVLWLEWAGWVLLAVMIVLAWRAWRERRMAVPLTILAVTFALTLWQIRWGCFLVLILAMALPEAAERLRPGWAVRIALVLLLWPLWSAWDATLYPSQERKAALLEARSDAVMLRDVAQRLRQSPGGAVLAPWWQSPPLAYWSGHPAVAGSSHESLGGIEAAAKFFAAADPDAGAAVLRDREVGWVVTYDPERVLTTAKPLLGSSGAPGSPLIKILHERPHQAPGYLHFEYGNPAFKLFKVSPSHE